MSIRAAEDQFEWRGPAAVRTRISLRNIFVSPKGQKVVPTTSGMILIVVGLSIGLAAYNTENNILFAGFAILIASLILSGIICWANFSSARWRIQTSSSHRVGEESEFEIVVENYRKSFPLFCLYCDVEYEGDGIENCLYLKNRLDSGESERLLWQFRPERRCSSRIVLQEVVSTFPFGFLRKHVSGECSREMIVWPQRIDYQKFTGGASGQFWLGRSSKQKGETGELVGLRGYRSGDAPKTIHWKASARQQRLVVKENASETMTLHSIYVDPSRYLWQSTESFEKMCSLAASLAEDFFLTGSLDVCLVVGHLSQKVKRLTDLDAFFDALSRLSIEDGSSGSEAFERKNMVVFKPTSGGGVGGFINGIQIAQA